MDRGRIEPVHDSNGQTAFAERRTAEYAALITLQAAREHMVRALIDSGWRIRAGEYIDPAGNDSEVERAAVGLLIASRLQEF